MEVQFDFHQWTMQDVLAIVRKSIEQSEVPWQSAYAGELHPFGMWDPTSRQTGLDQPMHRIYNLDSLVEKSARLLNTIYYHCTTADLPELSWRRTNNTMERLMVEGERSSIMRHSSAAALAFAHMDGQFDV